MSEGILAKRVLIVVNVGWFFVSHRLPVALAALQKGYAVHVAAALDPQLDDGTRDLMKAHGIHFHELRFSRSGSGISELLRDAQDLRKLFRKIQPDLIHLVTLKPVLIGGIIAHLTGSGGRVVLAVPGRGSVFSAPGFAAAVRRGIGLLGYRLAYRRGRTKVIVQNVEDRDYFLGKRIFAPGDVVLIRGSGVEMANFSLTQQAAGLPVVVMASRMLREKGVQDFVEAAFQLRGRGVSARFVLVGDPDPGNPKSHTQDELNAWVANGAVEWWGFRSDMPRLLAEAHIVCLPTYYGEGVPKVLIEAAAAGRPIVTTNTPGCSDIVRHEVNGLLVPARNVAALASALERLIGDAELRESYGARGRELAIAEFSLDIVLRQTMDVYYSLQVS